MHSTWNYDFVLGTAMKSKTMTRFQFSLSLSLSVFQQKLEREAKYILRKCVDPNFFVVSSARTILALVYLLCELKIRWNNDLDRMKKRYPALRKEARCY